MDAKSGMKKNSAVIVRTFGIDFKEPVNIVFCVILAACLLTAVIVYFLGGAIDPSSEKTKDGGVSFSKKVTKTLYSERDMVVAVPTITGIIPELLDAFTMGTLGEKSAENEAGAASMSDSELGGETLADQDMNPAGTITTTNEPDSAGSVSLSGAAMILDSGQGMAGYDEAASHSELVAQIDTALAANDRDFIGMKLSYQDDFGELSGYPQAVISNFTEYMSANAEKRSSFINTIANESYSTTRDTAYLILLPVIQLTVNMVSFDNVTVSVPGFQDQILNRGQSAVIKPMLPCMYTISFQSPSWDHTETKEFMADLAERTYTIDVETKN